MTPQMRKVGSSLLVGANNTEVGAGSGVSSTLTKRLFASGDVFSQTKIRKTIPSS
jgi:hypothetical protein